jgi:hypothetical protein
MNARLKSHLQNFFGGVLCGLLIGAPVLLSAFGIIRG